MKSKLALTLLSWFVVYSIHAQTNEYRFSRIDVSNGLSHNQIKAILKDKKGFLWIATISGLNRYDGYTVRTFTHEPNDSTSLISSDVNKIFQGPGNKLWIHTWSGVNVYNPNTENFNRNTDQILKSLKIPRGLINNIRQDSKGNHWFLHNSDGLFRYSEKNMQTERIDHQADDTTSIATNQVAAWSEDRHGNIWILHTNGILEKINALTLQVEFRDYTLKNRFRGEILEYHFMADRDGDLWFYIANLNAGVFRFNPSTKQWRHIDHTSDHLRLNTSIVRGIVEDEEGILWIATDHGGINLLNKRDETIQFILHDPDDAKSLSQNSVNVLYKDHDGIIWAGTFKNGISFYHRNINRFKIYKNRVSDPNSLPFNDINAIIEDPHKNLWIGTNGGGLIYYDRKRNSYKQYLHDSHNPNSLSTNVIVSLFLDRKNRLWIGTYFGGLLSFDGHEFVRYKHNPDDSTSISDNSVWEIFEDSGGRLWIGTHSQGVDLFDRQTKTFQHYNTEGSNPIHARYIPAFMEDREGDLWIGTGYGIDVLDRDTGRFTHYLNSENDPSSLSNNTVLAIHQDRRGLIWIATHGGLNIFSKSTNQFYAFTKRDGLPDNSILSILEDDNGNLWVSTPHGLSNVKIEFEAGTRDSLKLAFHNYDEKDGLQGIQFNENAACKTSDGELIFAGTDGFNLFKPEYIGINRNIPDVMLTDFQIFNKRVNIGEPVNGNIVLHKSITETDEVVLNYRDNVFSIEFTSLSQFHPEKSQYQYILEGFDKAWTTTNASGRRVTYTNLDPGEYVFKVKAANNDGVWNENATALAITVLPPFWRSGMAFVLYAVATMGALFLARWLVLYNERIKFQIQRERERAHRMHELDRIKIKFFTNVSHEFRTPLTLILTPLEKMLRSAPEGDQRNQFELIHRNARRLLNLVNQLLDFRKLEVQEIKLNTSEGDIIGFIRDVFHSFSDLSEKNNIRFTFHTSIHSIETLFDQDKVEKILFNLLSNAFKFTPEHGTVSVRLDTKHERDRTFLKIEVQDTGIGIPLDKQQRIFERFFQHDVPKSVVNQGSGIGLSITKEFVKVYGGTISVQSEPGKGSCFTVFLPLEPLRISPAQPEKNGPSFSAVGESAAITLNPVNHSGNKPVVLLVEDNEDFRFYLKDNLQQQYSVLEAKNGKEGLHLAISLLPDLIVSDIMMPEINGLELCKKIRGDKRVSHIPVILLTARTAEEQKIEGFESGANDYVTKPFNFEILQSRIKNLLAQREAFRKNSKIDVKTPDVQITSLDEKLITKAIRIVEENMAEADFTVEKFSRELGMSRVHLYKKLLSLTGKSPLDFIRTIRLQRAAQLLQKSQLSVSEIAYQVGFNNPKYFSKYFKEEFKVLPSAYASENKIGG